MLINWLKVSHSLLNYIIIIIMWSAAHIYPSMPPTSLQGMPKNRANKLNRRPNKWVNRIRSVNWFLTINCQLLLLLLFLLLLLCGVCALLVLFVLLLLLLLSHQKCLQKNAKYFNKFAQAFFIFLWHSKVKPHTNATPPTRTCTYGGV